VVDETSDCAANEDVEEGEIEETDTDDIEIIERPSKKRTRGM
jgi:hypothetical protein